MTSLLPSPALLPSPTLLPSQVPPPDTGVRPTVTDVGALLTARTVDAGGNELGTFNGATRPTNRQVDDLIDMAVADVLSRVGVEIPEAYWPEARRLAALQAAALVESSFFPRELDTDHSAYRQYTAMFLAGITQLQVRISTPSAMRLA
jgi:hypothetical protein